SGPVEIGISPAGWHGRFWQSRHFRGAGEGGRDWPHGAETPIFAGAAHACLLDIDDVGADRAQHVVAEAEAIQNAGRESFRDYIRLTDQILGDLQAFWMADVEGKSLFPGILVHELAAHV